LKPLDAPRRWHFHLSTALVLVFLGGFLLGLETLFISVAAKPTTGLHRKEKREVRYDFAAGIASLLILNGCILVFAAKVCEDRVRRKSAQAGHSSNT